MIFRKHRLSTGEILFLGAIGGLLIFISRISLTVQEAPLYDLKMKAATRTLEAFRIIKEERLRRGIPIDPVDDPMESGFIGYKDSPITTSGGNYDAKLTSINPNWSALVVQMLHDLGVKKGDTVAMHMTGSFPALNVAVIIGVETYGAVPVWGSSIGSSSWGANIPEFTWADMEKVLYDHGLIHSRSVVASIGGNNDVGAGLPDSSRELIREAIRRNGLKLLEVLPLQAAVDSEYRYLTAGGQPVIYINIGGGVISLGTVEVKRILREGINEPSVYPLIMDEPVEGLVAKFLKQGKYVINFLEIVRLARKYGLPVSPASMPEVGTGPLFYQPRYPVILHIILLIAYLVIIVLTLNGVFGKFFGNPPKKEEML